MDIGKSKNINGIYDNSSCSKVYIVIYIDVSFIDMLEFYYFYIAF